MEKQWTKLAVDDLCYVYGTYLQEGEIGIVVEVQRGREGAEPHIKFKAPGEKPQSRNYSSVGCGGGAPRACETKAIVKWIQNAFSPLDAIPAKDQHMEWQVMQVTDTHWALARDPWFGRLHWLCPQKEYRLDASEPDQHGTRKVHVVTMESLL